VAVLAPHPDDDVIGCGGTLCKHRREGEAVSVVFLTDGACGLDHKAPPSRRTAQTRRREAERAAGLLGIQDLVFLDFPDGGLAANQEAVDRLLRELERVDPQAVFLPFLLDDHPDHRAANRIFAAAAPHFAGSCMEVYAYEVWTPLPANRLVDISSVADIKEKAIRIHASQTGRMDYAAATLGLNRFRALTVTGGQGFCEAFFSVDAERYAALVRKTLGSRSR
jgi:LmbE family N-acetylglucosaminyl deacetylase